MAQRLYLPREQVFTDLGAIGAGWKLNSYETGTSTSKATYSDTALSSANANPIIADSAGRFGNIFVDDLATYKLVLTDADDNIVWTADPVDPKVFSLADFDPRPTSFWGTTAGTASAFTLDADPDVSAYSSTQTFYFACHLDNDPSATMAVDGLSALVLKKYDGTGSKVDIEAGDIQAGATYEARNDGTDIVILNPEKPTITRYGRGDELTISSAEITITHSVHIVDTEGDAASDDLETISGGQEDQILLLSSADNARNIVIKHGTGNIITDTQKDITLDITNDNVILKYDSNNWIVISKSIKDDFQRVAKAWVSFTDNGSVTVYDSYNIDSVVRNSTGNYTINFTTDFINANYAALVSGKAQGSGASGLSREVSKTTSSYRILFLNTSAAAINIDAADLVFFGDQ